MKNLLYRSRITKHKDVALYDMPVLEEAKGGIHGNLSPSQTIKKAEENAYEKAFGEGERAGYAAGEERAMALFAQLEDIIKAFVFLRENLMKELEPQVVELAVSIARKIMLDEVITNPDRIVHMAKEALMRIERTGQVTIKINQSLYDLFIQHKPDLLSIHPDIVFDIDPSASRYGSVVMGPAEDVVTDLDEQLKSLIKDMRDGLGAY